MHILITYPGKKAPTDWKCKFAGQSWTGVSFGDQPRCSAKSTDFGSWSSEFLFLTLGKLANHFVPLFPYLYQE